MSNKVLLIQWGGTVCENFQQLQNKRFALFNNIGFQCPPKFITSLFDRAKIISTILVVLFYNLLPGKILLGQAGCSAPSTDWQLSVGGSNEDFVKSVFITSDGGYIVAGETNSTNEAFNTNQGGEDVLVVKIDSIGNVQWQKLYGGSKIDNGNSIIQTSDGGYVVAARTNSPNGDVIEHKGGTDYWILKLDHSGNIEWQKAYGGSEEDVPFEIAQTADGGYIVAGHTNSNDGDVTGNHGSRDSWVIKLDVNGNLQWQKAFGGSMNDATNSVRQTEDGGYILCGNTLSNDGDVTFNHGQEDVWILRLDANGNLLWQKSMGGSGGDGAKAIDETLDHGVIVVGFTHSHDGDVVGTHGDHEIWVIRTDSLGNKIWADCIGGKSGDDGSAVMHLPDGTFLIGGRTLSNDGDISGNHGMHDGWIGSVDPNGVLLWQKCLGGTNDDMFYAFQVTPDGNYIVAGESKSNDGDATSNDGGADSWILKLKSSGSNLLYADNDKDGFGDNDITIVGCMPTNDYISISGDCDDNNSAVHPDATDLCNSIDDNCNGETDENGLTPILNPTGSVTVCRGDVLTLIADSKPDVTYQWTKDSKIIPGVTSASYTTGSSGTYQVTESNSSGCSGVSAATVIISQDEPSALITNTGNLDICQTGYIILKANGKSGISYQWKKGSTIIPGATNKTYTANAKGNYYVTLTNAFGCSSTSAGKKVTNSCRELSIKATENQLLVYPNPASDKVTVDMIIEGSFEGEATLQLTDMVGRVMYDQEVVFSDNHLQKEIDIGSDLGSGVYFVNVIVNGQFVSAGLSIQK